MHLQLGQQPGTLQCASWIKVAKFKYSKVGQIHVVIYNKLDIHASGFLCFMVGFSSFTFGGYD